MTSYEGNSTNQIPYLFTEREPQVLCYLTSWSSKRPSAGRFLPENIDPNLCTHVIFAFATLKDHKLAEGDEKDSDMYDKVVALREKNPNLKVRFDPKKFFLT